MFKLQASCQTPVILDVHACIHTYTSSTPTFFSLTELINSFSELKGKHTILSLASHYILFKPFPPQLKPASNNAFLCYMEYIYSRVHLELTVL